MNKADVQKLLRDWVTKRVKDSERVSLPDLADAGVKQFRGEQAIMAALAESKLREIVYAVAAQVAAEGRHVVALGDQLVSREEFKAQAATVGNRWRTWLEHVGDTHVALLSMTRNDVQVAVAERRQRASGEMMRADFLEHLGKKLTGDKKIGDVWASADIEALWTRLHNLRQSTQSKAS